MIKYQIKLVTIALLVIIAACAQMGKMKKSKQPPKMKEISVIPKPTKIQPKQGRFILNPQTKILIVTEEEKANLVADYLQILLNKPTGFQLESRKIDQRQGDSNSILLRLNDSEKQLGDEGYKLNIRTDGVEIIAQKPAGLFYGVQTLRQLFPEEIEREQKVLGMQWQVPCVEITDKPRFTWRGMHLDVCRHFFSKEFVKKYIDILAMHKLNTFHWHLTEDQGWRIEIKKYPKLTEIGAWRVDRSGITWREREPQQSGEEPTYGGYYTQEDVKEIVEYARKRFITVVPEIEMPGHALAALTAYPELSCFGGPFTVATGGYWPIKDIYCAGNDSTFIFLQNVLDEVLDLFPSKFIHIGGDEAYKENWKKCPKCQQRIKDEDLKDVHELQSYFIRRIEKYLNSRDRRLIGWDEILEGGLAPNATVMSWRGIDGGIKAANAGHDVVMSPTTHCYFDYYQGKYGEPEAIGGYLPLEKVYAFEPIPPDIAPEKKHHILGAQANLWTEYIPTPEHAEYMLLPRLSALAEVVWSPKDDRNYMQFINRMEKHFDRLKHADINYRVPTPGNVGGESVIFGKTKIAMRKPVQNAEIYYTMDGSVPALDAKFYQEPIDIPGDAILKARTVMNNGKMSNVVIERFILVDQERNGMQFEYYTGKWDSLPDFSQLNPAETGKCYHFDLDKIGQRGAYYAMVFKGFLEIDQSGEYTFSLISDDGSKLFINNNLIIDNDGRHGAIEKSGSVVLNKGRHPFEVQYLQSGGGEKLEVLYEGHAIAKELISPKMIFSTLDK